MRSSQLLMAGRQRLGLVTAKCLTDPSRAAFVNNNEASAEQFPHWKSRARLLLSSAKSYTLFPFTG
ncbi:hypothetical protein J6590_078063 [Homalodisca vitripennis]|nr:hypothetical protein J6590_078063 [Homalodisca vitripennis]